MPKGTGTKSFSVTFAAYGIAPQIVVSITEGSKEDAISAAKAALHTTADSAPVTFS